MYVLKRFPLLPSCGYEMCVCLRVCVYNDDLIYI